jgi:hypothetical protein
VHHTQSSHTAQWRAPSGSHTGKGVRGGGGVCVSVCGEWERYNYTTVNVCVGGCMCICVSITITHPHTFIHSVLK